jgi:uncharacterized protein (TIGR02466 family)
MIVETMFTSFIATDIIKIDNYNLESYCREQINISNKDSQSDHLNLASKQLMPVTAAVLSACNKIYKELGFTNDYRVNVSKAWTSLNNSRYIDEVHIHRNSFFSAVYYVKATGTRDNGTLDLLTPDSGIRQVVHPEIVSNYNSFNSDKWSIIPETGKLVIFPSWIMHYVTANISNKDRISIAFDTCLEPNTYE